MISELVSNRDTVFSEVFWSRTHRPQLPDLSGRARSLRPPARGFSVPSTSFAGRRVRSTARLRIRQGLRQTEPPEERRVARALADHHRPAPRATADAGELRVRRPQAPDPRHRPAPPRPAASGAPRPALHRPARRRLLPRLRAPAPPHPVPGPHGRGPARPRPAQRRRPRRPARPSGRATSPPPSTSTRPAPSWKPPRPSATRPAGPSPWPSACASPRPSRCSGRTSTCSTTPSRSGAASTASAAVA